MKKVEKEVLRKIKTEKNNAYYSFIRDEISLTQLVEKLSVIKKLEEMISENISEERLLDKREIRELAGKTLYISLPKEVTQYGWEKGSEAKIMITKDGRKIILEKEE